MDYKSIERSVSEADDHNAEDDNASCCVRGCRKIRRSKWTAVVVMFLAFMLDLMLLTVVEPVLPDILRSLAEEDALVGGDAGNSSDPKVDVVVSATAVGVLNGAKPLTQVVLNPFFGMLIDRVGHTVPMMVGFIFSFGATVGFAYGNSFSLLMVFRILQGLSSSLLTIAGLAMLSSVYTDAEERGKAMAYAFSGLAFGLLVGFPFGSILYQFLGREVPFLAMAGIIFIGAMIRFCLMPVWMTDNQDKKFRKEESHCSGLMVFTDFYIIIATGVYFCLCYGVGSVMAIGPLFLIDSLGAEQWQIGIIFLVGAISQTIFQYSIAPFAYRIGWWLLAMIGLLLVGVGVAFYGAVQTTWMIFVPQSVYAAGIGMVMGSIPALLGYLADIRVQSRYGAVFAMSDTGTNMGYFLGSLVTGIIVNEFSYFPAFAATGALVFLCAFLCLFLRKIPRKDTVIGPEERQSLLAASWRRASRHTLSFSHDQ